VVFVVRLDFPLEWVINSDGPNIGSQVAVGQTDILHATHTPQDVEAVVNLAGVPLEWKEL
jgi:hypothetical protein